MDCLPHVPLPCQAWMSRALFPPALVKVAEVRRLEGEREAAVPEVARVDAETAEVYAENQALNRQQAALGAEVRCLAPTGVSLPTCARASPEAAVQFSMQNVCRM